jgi:general secretion pathway protein C
MTAAITALVWAACAASVVAWGLRLGGAPLAVPPQAQLLTAQASQKGDPARLFAMPAASAADTPAPAAASRFRLVGVVAPVAGPALADPRGAAAATGVALLSVDAKPARAYRVGTVVDGGWVLQQVGLRSATLGPQDGAAMVQLELPALPAPATGRPAGAALPATAVAPPPPAGVAAPPVPPNGMSPTGLPGGVPGAVPGGLPGAAIAPPASLQPAAEAGVESLKAEGDDNDAARLKAARKR